VSTAGQPAAIKLYRSLICVHVPCRIHPAWAPIGAARFLELVSTGYFADVALFRCIEGFICQFGIAGNPDVNKEWKEKGAITDDAHITTNNGHLSRGMLSFAGGGADSRTTQLFVALKDSNRLGDNPWETPIGEVVKGMDVSQRSMGSMGSSVQRRV
jgi:peptidyl-prolyl cis-trans isomerase A (cyclophilin A)